MSNSAALDELVADLRAIFRADARGALAAKRLEAYAGNYQDWQPFAFFESGSYTRNLIEHDANFELLLLCWEAEQKSPIHNHEGQNCWMAVLAGAIEEVQYSFPLAPQVPRRGLVRAFAPGQVAFIRDEIGLHVVQSAGGQRGVSLHLYAKPFAECNIYCEQTGTVTRKRLSYHSIRGRRLQAAH